MADKNVQMQERNVDNLDWDNLFPKTKGAIVIYTDGKTGEEVRTLLTSLANEKIPMSLATAADMVPVSSGANTWVGKTLTQFKTWLGLKSAAFVETNTLATSAQGLTADAALPKAGGSMTGAINMQDQILQRPEIKDYAETKGTTPATTGSVVLDLSTGNSFEITPTGNVTFSFTNPPTTGKLGSITLFINNGATVYTKAFPASVKWDKDIVPVMDLPSKTAILTFVTKDGGNRWYGSLVGNGFAT